MDLNLERISNQELVVKIKSLKDSENILLADIVLYLSEIDRRKLYRELGYSSLFNFCRECLGYSEGAAYRRIQAARSLKDNPEIYALLKEGKVTLCALSEIAKVKELSAKNELIKASEGKSKREVQVLTAGYQEGLKPKKDYIRAKKLTQSNQPGLFSHVSCHGQSDSTNTAQVFEISIEVDKDFMQLLNDVKAMIGHVPTREVFRRTLKEFYTKRNTIKRNVKTSPEAQTRYIPKATKRAVVNNSGGQCCYQSENGKRCTERHGLEIDHIKPYALGGSRDVSNLRLLCKAHNLLMAEKTFGKERVY